MEPQLSKVRLVSHITEFNKTRPFDTTQSGRLGRTI